MLHLLDKLAGWWLDMRFRAVTESPELGNFQLKRAVIEEDGFTIQGISPMAAVLAEQMAMMLQRNNAENYIEFDMMPRLDRELKPVRVTVAWANGKSPGQRVIEMEREVERLRKQYEGTP